MSVGREGPRLELLCFGCAHHRQEREVDVEADEEDFYHSCKHPQGQGAIGYKASTPAWCPCLPAGVTHRQAAWPESAWVLPGGTRGGSPPAQPTGETE